MSFERFPYTNFHELNLDWIVQKLKEAYSSENPPDYPVKSVNGMTGDVILAIPSIYVHSVNGETGDVVLYRNPLTQFPATDETRWNLFRICDGTEQGIEFDADSAKRIAGTRRILIYDEDNPPDYPVTSVNGQTGDVQVTAGVQSVNGKTGNVVTPFVNPNTDILTLDSNSPSVLWGISRNVAGGNVALYITTGGTNPQAFIRYIPDEGEAINLPLLTNADIPSSAGVVSVNTKSGAVTLYGTDIKINDSSAYSIASYLINIEYNIDGIITSLMEFDTGNEALQWDSGYYNAATGTQTASSNHIRSINFIPEKYCIIKTNALNLVFSISAWDSTNQDSYAGVLTRNTKSFAPDNTLTGHFYDSINLQELHEMYPQYKFKLACRYEPIASINMTATPYINLYYPISNSGDSQEITELRATVTEHTTQISALQTADTRHDQQISALQTTTNSYAQQIAELYTRVGTGIKEVKFTDVVSLPIRYPETGTDADITENMACVNAVLSRPGVQITNLTIVFYNGYLTISGTVRGMTDIILYLTKT